MYIWAQSDLIRRLARCSLSTILLLGLLKIELKLFALKDVAIEAAALACGREPGSLDLRSFDPSGLDPKARKGFPLRLSHFLTDISRVERELAWTPRFDARACMEDSYKRDYALAPTRTPDFSTDQVLIGV